MDKLDPTHKVADNHLGATTSRQSWGSSSCDSSDSVDLDSLLDSLGLLGNSSRGSLDGATVGANTARVVAALALGELIERLVQLSRHVVAGVVVREVAES